MEFHENLKPFFFFFRGSLCHHLLLIILPSCTLECGNVSGALSKIHYGSQSDN